MTDLTTIPYVPFGKTGLTVSRLGLGTYCLVSERNIDHESALSITKMTKGLGVNLIDTAPLYGCGEAEQIVGEGIGSSNGNVVIDKVGRFEASIVRRRATEAYRNPDLLRAQIEHSLRTLQRNPLECMLIHEADDDCWGGGLETGKAPVCRVLREFQDEGSIQSIGVSLRDADRAVEMAQSELYDAMLFVHYYNLVWQEPGEKAVAAATDSGMGVVIGAPFRRGLLLDGSDARIRQLRDDPPRGFTRGAIERLHRAHHIAKDAGIGMGELGLRYLLSDHRVHSVLVGVENCAQLTENAEWCANGALPNDVHSAVVALREVDIDD